MSAAFLIAQLHGELLRGLSKQADVHFQGLSQASRSFAALSTRQRRRLRDLDSAFNFRRHITEPLAASFTDEILATISGPSPPLAEPTFDKDIGPNNLQDLHLKAEGMGVTLSHLQQEIAKFSQHEEFGESDLDQDPRPSALP